MSLSIGTSFSYNFCSENNGNPLPAVVKKKNKSEATRRRDQKRRSAFLHRKAASSSLSLALDRPLPESPEVNPSQFQPISPSPSLGPRPLDTEPNDFEDISSRVRQKCPKCMKSTIPSWILFQWPHTMSEHFLESMADHYKWRLTFFPIPIFSPQLPENGHWEKMTQLIKMIQI